MTFSPSEYTNTRTGRVIPRWRYYSALIAGVIAIAGARLQGIYDGAHPGQGGMWSLSFWLFVAIVFVFQVLFGLFLSRYRKLVLV